MKHDRRFDPMLDLLPKEQVERVLKSSSGDIDLSFLGFTDTYKHLSQIIPKHFTVIDFGAAYNPQCFYFTEHAKFIAVEPSGEEVPMFQAPNCEIFRMSAGQFISENINKFHLDSTFAIANYVPNWYSENTMNLVRSHFKNVYTFYPYTNSFPFIAKKP